MVSKTVFALFALAMMAGTAQATMQLDAFLVLANEPNVDNFKLLVFWQVYAWLVPLIAGPSYVFLNHMWSATAADIDFDGNTISITYGTALSLVGIGNFDTLFMTFMGLL